MISILFFIKRHRLLRTGQAPIYVRVSANRAYSEFGIGRGVDQEQWVTARGRVKPVGSKNKALNAYLDKIEYDLFSIAQTLQNEGKQVTAKAVTYRYRGIDKPQISFIDLCEEHNRMQSELVGKTVAAGTAIRYQTSLNHLKEFMQTQGKNDIYTDDITVEFLEKYVHFLLVARKQCNNTVVKYLKNISKIINIAIAHGVMKNNPIALLKLRLEETKKDFLTEEELHTMSQVKFENPRYDRIRDIFLFCCYTGLAYADVYSLTTKEIVTGKEGKQWIVKARTKTHSLCNIPLLKPAMQILERYADFAKAEGRLLPVPSNQTMNDGLKEIAELCGINKQLTTHCARHTFATTVTLANNVSIENVSQMLGHSNIKMTQHYAKVLNTSISRDMEKVEAELSL